MTRQRDEGQQIVLYRTAQMTDKTEVQRTYMEHGEARIEEIVIALGAVATIRRTDGQEELVGPGDGFRVT